MKVKSELIFRARLIHHAIIAFAVFSSSLAFGDELKILSNVSDSSVYEIKNDSNSPEEVKVLLGKTPHTIGDSGASEVRVLRVEKSGYTPVYLPLFGHLRGTTVIRVSMKKISDWTPLAEQIVDEIYAVQTMIDSKQAKPALESAASLHQKYPGSIAVSLVYANALLLNGDFTLARGIYTAALDQVPASRKQLRNTLAQVVAKLSGQKLAGATDRKKGATP